MSGTYNGLQFETELEARWAAFFDLAGWTWQTGPVSVANWKPDFRVTFPCNHSECAGDHTVLVSVLPVNNIDGLKGHPALNFFYSVKDSKGAYLADAGAIFGANPLATYWEMAHGSGSGSENVASWVSDAATLWDQAGQKIAIKG